MSDTGNEKSRCARGTHRQLQRFKDRELIENLPGAKMERDVAQRRLNTATHSYNHHLCWFSFLWFVEQWTPVFPARYHLQGHHSRRGARNDV